MREFACMVCGHEVTPSHWTVQEGNNLHAGEVCGHHTLYECFRVGLYVRIKITEDTAEIKTGFKTLDGQ